MKLKKIIIILIALVLIFLIILAILLVNKANDEIYFDPPTSEVEVEIIRQLSQVDSINNYYAVQTCINKFYQYLTKINTDESEDYLSDSEKINQQAIYNMLDRRYIDYRNITLENIFDIIPQIEESSIIIDQMYVSQKNANISAYIVRGRLSHNITHEKQYFYNIVEVDMKNRTFKVLLEDYIEDNIGNIELGKELNLNIIDEIEKNTYNIFDYENISEETYVTDIFNRFSNNMVYDFEEVYNHLDSEYREAKFNTYEQFEEYARNVVRVSLKMKLSKYQKNEFDEYTQYVFLDQNENYYIFNIDNMTDYTIMLDTYTVDLPQFTEQYNNSNNEKKVLLNLQKVFEAINRGDYKYVYNKLDPTFKANNFATLDSFEKYMSDTFFDKNTVGYEEYQTRGNLHIYKLKIKNEDDREAPEIEKNFIMQLKEGTDFVMSFEI